MKNEHKNQPFGGHKSIFPYFGGKSKIAPEIWNAFGDIRNYVEPFAGSAAVFFQAPYKTMATLNDASGLMVNLWRAIKRRHVDVAEEAAMLNGEADLHAAELECLNRPDLVARLEAELEYCEPKLAGRYLYGLCNKIGSFAVRGGPWFAVDGVLTDRRTLPHLGDAGTGISRTLPHLGDAGKGISREIPHLGNAGTGISRKLPNLGSSTGISRKLPHLGDAGMSRLEYILGLMDFYVERLQHARITCGDWKRVACSKSVTSVHGTTGIFLDPPYEKSGDLYANNGSFWDVVKWAASEAGNPELRIVIAGYFNEKISEELPGWEVKRWKQRGGYGGARNSALETIWVSPQCVKVPQEEIGLVDTPQMDLL